MTRTTTLKGRRLGIAVVVLALFALLGTACQNVQPPGVAPWNPTGSLDFVAGGTDEVRVAGWAGQWQAWGFPQEDRPLQIVVMVNGQWVPGVVEATNPRPDVHWFLGTNGFGEIQQPSMGYGFDFTVPAAKGEATVCVAVLNQDLILGGDHVLLGCRTVTVA